jgi:putative ABC transport system permease protein
MLIGETVRMALSALRANKLRSFLTMLGIVIGVAALIAMVALGRGAQEAVNSRIAALGTTLLTVIPGQARGFGGVASASDRVPLTMDDSAAVENRATYVLAVQPEMSRSAQVQYGNHNTSTSVVGTSANYLEVRKFTLAAGRMFTSADDNARRRLVVLGSELVTNLSAPSADALVGAEVRINGVQFDVIGVLASKGQGGGFANPDDQVLVPIQTARFRLIGSDRLRVLNVLAPTEDDIPLTMADVQKILRREHRLRQGQSDDFTIRNQADFLTTLGETSQVFGLLLAGIAAVSLVVGGIGIMNIMLVSVTERTREIGIRKSMGATRHNILIQFLTEALVLCMLGGMIGIGVGTGASMILHKSLGWSTSVGGASVLVAVLFSGAVGIIFGVWPARRAAALDAIEALRYE